METIPAVIREMNDEDAAADALLENFQREDLNAIEKARAVQGLLKFMSYEKGPPVRRPPGKRRQQAGASIDRSREVLSIA